MIPLTYYWSFGADKSISGFVLHSLVTTPPAASSAALPPVANPIYELPPHPLLLRLLQPPDALLVPAHGDSDRDRAVVSDRAPPRPREHPAQRDGRRQPGTHRPRAPTGRHTSTTSVIAPTYVCCIGVCVLCHSSMSHLSLPLCVLGLPSALLCYSRHSPLTHQYA